MKKIILILALLLISPFNASGATYKYDLGINSSDISFTEDLVAGEQVRIYASVHNYGSDDVSGYVSFYQGDKLIGDSQVISVRANGLADEVYVDWIVPTGSFNIRADINGQKPKDENSQNDLTVSQQFIPLLDTDGDGIPDKTDPDDDNDGVKDEREPLLGTDPLKADTDSDGCLDGVDAFPLDASLCVDTDSDGIDDGRDNDDDNDGLSDTAEKAAGTNPKVADTDGDGVIDGQDYCPLDSKCTKNPNEEKVENTVGTVISNTNALAENSGINENINNENLNSSAENINITNQEGKSDEAGYVLLDSGNSVKEPNLSILALQKSWDTYILKPQLRGILDENLVYAWHFGDGSLIEQKMVEHQYMKPGKYQITLQVSGENGLELESKATINISFFNPGNLYLWLVFGGLAVLLLIIIASLFTKKENKDDY